MLEKIKYAHIPESKERSFHFDYVKIYWDEQVTFHEQKSWELSYVITGSGQRIIGDTIEPFSRNEIILIPPDIPHCWSFCDCYIFDFTANVSIQLTKRPAMRNIRRD